MKYKVGGRVRVIEDLEVYKVYGGLIFKKGMQHARGKVVTIGNCFNDNKYSLEEDSFEYWWSPEMLEPALKRGDKVSVGNGSAERLFLNHTEGAHYPYRCVTGGDEQKFWAGETFRTCNWPDCKPIEKPKPKKYTITDPEGKTVELNDSMAEFCMYLMRDDMKNKTIQIINS